jgi:hypothetical protein
MCLARAMDAPSSFSASQKYFRTYDIAKEECKYPMSHFLELIWNENCFIKVLRLNDDDSLNILDMI